MAYAKTEKCRGCPSYENLGRCIGSGVQEADIIFLGGAPSEDIDPKELEAFNDYKGEIFKKIIESIVEADPDLGTVGIYYAQSIQCATEKESIDVIKQCAPIVHGQFMATTAKVIVPLGITAIRSVGLSVPVTQARGKIFNIRLSGKDYICMPTYNPGALLRKEKTGLMKTFKHDITRALKEALGINKPLRHIPELTKNYRIAKTIDEGKKVCQEILNYTPPNGEPFFLAVDTETTGLDTWREDFRIIAISFAWGPGLAGAILLDHREHETQERWKELFEPIEKILAGPAKKVFHNLQYDFKVLCLAKGWSLKQVAWDTMFGEYLLDENKKGLYKLKEVVRWRLPEFADYEKTIKEQLKAKDSSAVIKELLRQQASLTTNLSNFRAQKKEQVDTIKSLKAYLKDNGPLEKLGLTQIHEAKTCIKGCEERKAELIEQIKTATDQKKEITENVKALREADKQDKLRVAGSTFEDIQVDDMLLYAAIDADCTRQILLQQKVEVEKEAERLKVAMVQIMIPGCKALAHMEFEGVRIDQEYLTELEEKFDRIMDEEEKTVFRLVKREFNIDSTHQLENILVSTLGIQLTKRTKTGIKFQLNEEVLNGIEDKHESIKHLLRYRKAKKAKDTYLKSIREKSAIDGKVHCNFNMTTTATGRLSSSAPNLQNLPSKILDLNIKKLFIADNEDEYMCDLDYSGAEVRILCVYAADPALIAALNKGLNMHSHVASKVFGLDYDEIQNRGKIKESDPERYEFLDKKRQTAKAVVFLTIYGGGARKLHENVVKEDASITLDECEATIKTFLDEFPIIRQYMAKIKSDVTTKGFVETIFGRRRRFPLASYDWKLRNDAFKEGINMPVQSTCSDLVVDRLVDMHNHREVIQFKPRITVHDSVVFSFPKTMVPLLKGFLDEYAQDRITQKHKWMPVPFVYEASYGRSYGECTIDV